MPPGWPKIPSTNLPLRLLESMLKFLADIGISPKAVAFLRSEGYDALHLIEEQLERLSDGEIIEKAKSEGWVILTHDLDFGDLMAASGDSLPSVVIFRLSDMRPANVTLHLRLVLAHYENLLRNGAILSITQGRVRVRRLPV